MSLPDDYLQYGHRRRGNDHERFEYSPLPKRRPVVWPNRAQVAIFVTVHFEFYPLDATPQPFPVPGAFYLPPPNFLQYTVADYGNRIGAYRLFQVLDSHSVKATAVFNSEVARRYPRLVQEAVVRGWEVACGGMHMGKLIHGGMAIEEESALVRDSLATLRAVSGKPVVGWHSPAHSESDNTLDLLADNGIEYVMDWVNDDMPYAVRTKAGLLHSMPITEQWADDYMMAVQRQPVDELHNQGLAAYIALKSETHRFGGRILSLPLHAWVTGQPFRIKTLDRLLTDIESVGGQWSATGAEILSAFRRSEAVDGTQ